MPRFKVEEGKRLSKEKEMDIEMRERNCQIDGGHFTQGVGSNIEQRTFSGTAGMHNRSSD